LEFVLYTDEFEWEETTTNELPDFSVIEKAILQKSNRQTKDSGM
jgi:hypothetical protein